MADTATVVDQAKYSSGLSYAEFLEQANVNLDKFEEYYGTAKVTDEDAAKLRALSAKPGGPKKMLAIGEDWCPDVHRGLPIIAKIAEASGMELRFFPRDKNVDLINFFLKEGKYQSIPVFAFFDGNFNPIGHWIERPAEATRFQDEIRATLSQQKLSDDDTRKLMREKTAPLTESWRQETVKELRELLGKAAAT